MALGAAPLVVIFVHPVVGRINPALLLASRVAASGAQVAFAYPRHLDFRFQEARSRITKEDLEKIQLVQFELDFGEPPNPREFNFLEEFKLIATEFRTKLKSYLLHLPQPPACFISDEVSAPITKLAQELNLRTYIFVPESAFALSATLYAPVLAKESRLPYPSNKDESELLPPVEIPSVATIKFSEYLSPYSDRFPTWLRNTFLESAVAAQHSDGLLINTFTNLEHKTLAALREEEQLNHRRIPVLAVGPLIPVESSTAKHECIEFLDRHPPGSVVFVAFGSLRPSSDENEVREIFEGLKASGYPFIWMLRCNEDWIPGETGGGLIVRNWAPQLQILSHPSTGVFLSHCGWNSTIESLSLGVPVLGFPCFMDQHLNMKLVESHGAGMKLPALHGKEIETCLRKIMESKEIRHAARKLKCAASLVDKGPTLNMIFEGM